MKKKEVTRHEKERLIKLRKDGLTIVQIAKLTGAPYSAIKTITKANEKYTRRVSEVQAIEMKKMRDNGFQVAEIATKFNFSEYKVRCVLSDTGTNENIFDYKRMGMPFVY